MDRSEPLDLGEMEVTILPPAPITVLKERTVLDLSFIGGGLMYRCWPWESRCDMVDAHGVGWSFKRRNLVPEDDVNLRELPVLLRDDAMLLVEVIDHGFFVEERQFD